MAVIAQNRKRILYASSVDLTLDGMAMGPEHGYESVDVTTFNDSARRNEPGVQVSSISYSGLFNAAASRSYSVLRDMLGTTAAVSYYSNGDGSGEVGVGFSSAYVESDGFQAGPGEAEAIDAQFVQENVWHSVISVTAKNTITASAVSGTYDRGVTSTTTAGGYFYLHVFTNVATGLNDQWIVRLQDATTATGAYSDLATLTLGSGTLAGTAISFAGTFNRFVRGSAERDATGGTLSYQISFYAAPDP